MKSFLFALFGLCLVSTIASASDEPAVSAGEAVDIAEKSLNDRSLKGKIYIQSVTLDKSSIIGGQTFWFVRWSKSLPASDPKNREVGVKVYMDGRAVRLVKEPGTP